jgi:hypothetical protein
MRNLSQINLFTLLGLEALSEQEKQQYLLKISQISVKQAIEKAIKDGKLNVSDVERLTQQESDPIKFQETLIQMSPDIKNYVEDSINNMKIEILQQQIDKTIQSAQEIDQRLDLTDIIELRNYINKSTQEIDGDTLMEKVNLFHSFQNKMLVQQDNGN